MVRRFSSPRWTAPSVAAPNEDRPNAQDFSLSFGCLRIAQFPIWAVHFNDAALASRPLLLHRGGKVVAACSFCLQSGVRIGWTLSRAGALYPDAMIREHNPAETAYVWDIVLQSLYDITPRLEPVRPGLLFFAPPCGGSRNWLPLLAAVARLARQWKATVAVGPDRNTAEIAAYVFKPGCVRRIQPGQTAGFLSRVPCTQLTRLGLSDPTAQKLEWFGFSSVADLQTLSRDEITSLFAEPGACDDAALLWRYARAGTPEADRQPVQSYKLPPVCKARIVMAHRATNPVECDLALWEAIQQASAQLHGMSAGAITLSLVVKNGQRIGNKLLREPASSPRMLLRHAQELRQVIVQESDEVQVLEVHLSQLRGGSARDIGLARSEYASGPGSSSGVLRVLRSVESRYAKTLWRWLRRGPQTSLPGEGYTQVSIGEHDMDIN